MEQYSKLDELPNYTLSDVARYLRLPTAKTKRWATALLSEGSDSVFPLTFANLLEMHILKSLRVEHALPLQRIRRAVAVLKSNFPSPHPLLDRDFRKSGLDLLIETDGMFVNLNRGNQLALRESVELYADRIDTSQQRLRYFPFVAPAATNTEPRLVVLDPAVAFGRPVLAGTGISTEVIAGRFRAGDSITALMAEYQVSLDALEEGIRLEWPLPHAA